MADSDATLGAAGASDLAQSGETLPPIPPDVQECAQKAVRIIFEATGLTRMVRRAMEDPDRDHDLAVEVEAATRGALERVEHMLQLASAEIVDISMGARP